MRRFAITATACAAALAGTVATACSPTRDLGADGRLVVAVAFSPIEDLVRAVGGDEVHIVTVVPPGEEAHEYEPTPKQVTRLEQADVVFYLGGGFQPSVEQAVHILPGRVTKVDLAAPLQHLTLGDGVDPHVWLDPTNMQRMADEVRVVLAQHDAGRAAAFSRQFDEYDARLAALDGEFRDGLQQCASTALVTGHEAFGYLAHAYGLTQVAIAGISPGDEPSAKALEQVSAYVRDRDVRTIFFEENLPPDLARTVAGETGATTAVLNTVESFSSDEVSAGVDYVQAMRDNLVALRTGLGCT